MLTQIQNLKSWLKARDKRERIFLLCMLMAFTWLFWKNWVVGGINADIKLLNDNIQATQTNITGIASQQAAISSLVTQNAFPAKMQQKNALTFKTENFRSTLLHMISTAVSEHYLSNVTSDILNQQQGISLVDFKNIPPSPWITEESLGMQLPPEVKGINKFGLMLEFYSTYPNTVDYLVRLEKLPWHLYWDSLDYKVTDYPNADVKLQFYVLSNRQGKA